MKRRAIAVGLIAAYTSVPMAAQAQDPLDYSQADPDNALLGAVDDATTEAPPPPTAAPTQQPPAPTNVPPPPAVNPPPQPQQQAPSQTLPTGQWIYTQQYGWVYAPYDQNYTYVDPDATAAQMYVYRPTVGWGWYVSPWVLSVGPRPYWGSWGPNRFVWYSHPWFHARPRYYGPGWGPRNNVYGPRRWGPGPAHAHPRGAWGGGGRRR